jgi:hypothetical protein
MTRLTQAWRVMSPEQRLAVLASLGLLLTMFFPWYGLQSLNRRTGTIESHNISAFGDVSFVEAAVFLVALGVIAMVLARVEGREFHLPGGDGTIVTIAGGWAGLLIFYRVFDRPAGHGYPVGIEWGFFLAFVAAGCLAYAGLRMRSSEASGPPLTAARGTRLGSAAARGSRPEAAVPPARTSRSDRPTQPDRAGALKAATPTPEADQPDRGARAEEEVTVITPAGERASRSAPVPARARPRYPPAPSEQLSFEDSPAEPEEPLSSD